MARGIKSNTSWDAQKSVFLHDPRLSNKKIITLILSAYLAIILTADSISISTGKSVGNVYLILVPSTFALFSIFLALKSPPQERKLLVIFALFAVFRAIAETTWIIYESVLFLDTFPSLADFFWLVGYVLIAIFFHKYLKPIRKVAPNSAKIIATIVAMTHLIPTASVVFMLNQDSSYFEFLVSLAYPIGDAVFLWQVTASLVVLFNKKQNHFLSLLMLGIIGFIVSDTLFVFMTDTYQVGSPIDAGWAAGYLLFLFAVFNYRPLNQIEIEKWNSDKKIQKGIGLETLIKFVIPVITLSVIFVAAIIIVNQYRAEESLGETVESRHDVYFLTLIVGVFAAIIFIQNKNLLKFVKMRTKELEQERDKLQVEINEKVDKLVKAERLFAIGELSARIAHDMRNPLSIIKTGIEMIQIKDQTLSKETKDIIPRINRAVVRMSHQIDNVLDYVSPKPLQLKPIKVSELFNSVLERILIPPNITISLPKNDLELSCDSFKMEVVFVNLITNSIQAMSNKGVITLRALENKKEVVLEVDDTGPGIPPELLQKIFDPLFTTRMIGTGLGLPSCKSIVEKHGGVISVQSQVGKGTTFSVKIPKMH